MMRISFLAETFGKCGRPKVLFQGDTFGHSREQALLSSLMVHKIKINEINKYKFKIFAHIKGFDALFFGRVSLEEKTRREDENELEMIWSGNQFPGWYKWIYIQ